MANSSSFIGEIPRHYDEGLGPTLFADFADLLVTECCVETVEAAMELASGTGIVSRKLRDSLPDMAHLLVTDLNAPMLDVARRKFSDGERIDFSVVNAMELPFEQESFDLLLCQFGVMFFPDKVKAFREALRVLRPGGRYVFNVFSAMQENPHSQLALAIPAQFFPGDPPGFYKVPFHYGDPERVRADLEAAGWSDVTHKTIRLNKKIEDPAAFARGLVCGNPVIEDIRALGDVDPETVIAAVLRGLQVTFGPADMHLPLEATMFTCTVR